MMKHGKSGMLNIKMQSSNKSKLPNADNQNSEAVANVYGLQSTKSQKQSAFGSIRRNSTNINNTAAASTFRRQDT